MSKEGVLALETELLRGLNNIDEHLLCLLRVGEDNHVICMKSINV